MITYQSFVIGFPEFTDSATFPTATVNYWIAQAYSQLNSRNLGAQIDYAASLFTAHNLVLAAQSMNAAASGAPVGAASGPISGKAAGGLSVTYDTGAAAIPGAGVWNSTSYGQRLYLLMRGAASGTFYVPGPSPFPRPMVGRWGLGF